MSLCYLAHSLPSLLLFNPVEPSAPSHFLPVNKHLEPFADDLWEHEIDAFIAPVDAARITGRTKELFFGGLYQKVVYTV